MEGFRAVELLSFSNGWFRHRTGTKESVEYSSGRPMDQNLAYRPWTLTNSSKARLGSSGGEAPSLPTRVLERKEDLEEVLRAMLTAKASPNAAGMKLRTVLVQVTPDAIVLRQDASD